MKNFPPKGRLAILRGGEFFTPLQDLLGRLLPLVYEEYFDIEPTVSRPASGGKPDSSYIRFACAVGREFGGEEFKPETVASYLASWKKRKR